MSRLWPRAAYAEDQEYGYSILGTHVLFRGFQSGAIVGSMVIPIRSLLSRRNSPARLVSLAAIVRSTGVGAAVGTGLMAVALPLRMWGREEIEWKDRSWRLLENKGQVEVDTWSTSGAVAGAAAVMLRNRGLGGLGWRTVMGSAGMGSVVGIGGYMGWRYGVNGGKWPE